MTEDSQSTLYRKLKQNLCRDQILPEDQEAFAEYLPFKRTDGTNIDNWTYDELVYCVYDFKDINNIKTQYKVNIVKEAEEKTGFFSSDTFYYIETRDTSLTNSAVKSKWSVKRTKQQFMW